jgi:hypothetical protein
MELNYLTTRIDGIGSVSFADDLITPLRWLVNGKHYRAVRKVSDQSFTYMGICQNAPEKKIAHIAKHILGFLGTIIALPFLLIGLAIKVYTANEYSKENYAFVQSIKTSNSPTLFMDKFSKAPARFPLTDKEKNEIETIKLEELLNKWEAVGKNSSNYQTVKDQLTEWIHAKVPNPSTYNFINKNVSENAAIDLQQNIKLIIMHMKGKEDDLVEKIILSLYDASTVCAPTWVEVAKKEAENLRGIGGPEQRLLRHIQNIKEELILDFVQQTLDREWHSVNYARWIIGEKFGLDTSTINYDSAVTYKPDPQFNKSACEHIFYELYTKEELIQRLVCKINLDNLGSNNGLDQDLGSLLGACADRIAQESGVNINDEEYESSTYVMDRFYDKKDQMHSINAYGVEQLLIQIQLMG